MITEASIPAGNKTNNRKVAPFPSWELKPTIQ
jgi:hypothetical protein